MIVKQKNQTKFAEEMRTAFEYLLNYIATESDSDRIAMWLALGRAESHSFPTQYELALTTAIRNAFLNVNDIDDFVVSQNKSKESE